MANADARPWALHITRNFPPLLGGMERLNEHLVAGLMRDSRVWLCGPAGCSRFAPQGLAISESRVRPLALFLLSAGAKSLKLALALRPVLVLAGSGLTAPIACFAAWLAGGKSAVYLHGLDIVVPSRIYRWLWLPMIRRCELVLVNSVNTARLATEHGIDSRRITILNPGTGIPVLDLAHSRAFQVQQGAAPGQKILLTVGRFTRRKGLLEFVSRSLPAIAARWPGVLLVIIGGEASDALTGNPGSEQHRITQAAASAGVLENLRFIGHCDEDMLGAAFQAADCHIFPGVEVPGDVEGFGMVALEASAHGLPTVAFNVGGVADAVAQGVSGHLVSPGDYVAFTDEVNKQLADGKSPESVENCRSFASRKSWAVFEQGLRDAIGRMS